MGIWRDLQQKKTKKVLKYIKKPKIFNNINEVFKLWVFSTVYTV